ncbi:MAG: PIN-like domain-containing protein [Balneolaceae bacterium]
MKKTFDQFYKPEEKDFKKIWRECQFIFDANVLLDLYRYTDKTANDIWKVFEEIKDRVWIPYQVGLEFHYIRPSRILEQEKLFDQAIQSLNKASDEAIKNLKETFKNTTTHPSIDEKEILSKINSFFDSLSGEISERKEQHPDLLRINDPILDNLTQYFDGKVGKKNSEEELEELYKQAETRYKKEIPPGFSDSEKDGNKKYGDFIIWKEILDFAKKDSVKSIIFVTNDSKKDWWNKSHGRIIGPHPDLIHEFNREVGKKYYQYKSEMFLQYSKEYIVDVSNESIDEAKMISESISKKIEDIQPENLYYYDSAKTEFIPFVNIIKSKVIKEYDKAIREYNVENMSKKQLISLYNFIDKFKEENPNLFNEIKEVRGKILGELVSRGASTKDE